uniref:Olfactory receptor n=1 Tax=Sphenodon punctatus TaxID=8508 RepID=A0A8D0GNF0_SPHPU
MRTDNITSLTEFVLLGFLNQAMTQAVLLFAMIVFISFIALLGNFLLLILIHVDSALHTPMYFFLSQLAFMDICQILATVPKMSVGFVAQKNIISVAACRAQIFFMLGVGEAECLLLAVTSYDRYAAICSPLQYPVLMSRRICRIMTSGVWLCASLDALMHAVYVMQLPYCKSNLIDQFFCEVPALLKLSCSNTSTYETLVFLNSVVFLLIPFSVILASYIHVLSAILRIRSVEGRRKAFSTCSSHLTVVGLFYGSAIFIYTKPSSYRSQEQDKLVSLLCTVVTATLNPLIYSLRNKEVLAAVRKLFMVTYHF